MKLRSLRNPFQGEEVISLRQQCLRRVSGRAKAHSITARLVHPTASTAGARKQDKEALLCQRLKGHSAAITALLVTSDSEQCKEFITSSLDKAVKLWQLPVLADDAEEHSLAQEAVCIQPEGAPIFSLAAEVPILGSTRQHIFCGNAAKSVVAWEPPSSEFQEKVVLNGHSGWVRALATDGRWLFSAGCNAMAQWDLTRAVPRKVREMSLFTGDIQGLAAGGGRVFSCGADGSIRSWEVGKKGELSEGAARDKAHKERVSAILYHSGFLYSVSMDGSVKMWDATSLELVMCAREAHEGGKVHCAAVGPDGNLYTGGDDKLVRRWRLGTLMPAGDSALYCHNHPVRALAAGPLETLVSGDSAGEVAVWRI